MRGTVVVTVLVVGRWGGIIAFFGGDGGSGCTGGGSGAGESRWW